MARKLMAQYACSRCKREWYVDFEEGQKLPDPPSFSMLMAGLGKAAGIKVEYPELCSSCTKAVVNYATSISKHLRGKSPKRAKKEASEDPSFSPPLSPSMPPVSRHRDTSSGGSTSE